MTNESIAQIVRQHLQVHARPDVLDGVILNVLFVLVVPEEIEVALV